jgi:hypothetical protein
MDLVMLRTVNGLIPGTEDAAEYLTKIKPGTVVRCKATRMRNGPFFRKWWALVGVGYDLWREHATMPTYQGEPIAPNRDRFRRDLTIMCGFYTPVANLAGEVRLEAASLAWDRMTEDEFEKLYSKTIDVLLAKVLPLGVSDERRLRESADALLRFA